ncbi:MAG: Mov34/MPN/PAD-1 family protein [Verrucomicrobia bacterium]|nr:Mov34/MPN/PAD-1 family protein [Verrucomicrobiota bacterium]
MLRDDYSYALEVQRTDQTALGQYRLTVDWGPAMEWLKLRALGSAPGACSLRNARVEPRWHPQLGEPYVGGVRIAADDGPERELFGDLTTDYFQPNMRAVGRALVEQQQLKVGETFTSKVVAFPGRRETPAGLGLRLAVDELETPVPLESGRLAEHLERSRPLGDEPEGDLPVFVPQHVLREAAALTRKAEANETGGILIGQLHRDPAAAGLFLVVNALIPARHALSETAQLTFTAETWAAAAAALELRRSREQMVGWFHSHPARYWCGAKCPAEARRQCPLNTSFFSQEDCALQRTVFPRAFCVALLVTNAYAGLRYALFGWRGGLVKPRGFQVLNPTGVLEGEVAVRAIVGGQHEKNCG